ncbi:MAG: hypothetical protein UHT92_04315 [Prevotella sp.]|nr:hypothetical protein [Prevotella sp.]
MKNEKKNYGANVRVSEETGKNMYLLRKFEGLFDCMTDVLDEEVFKKDLEKPMLAVLDVLHKRLQEGIMDNITTHVGDEQIL